MAPSAFHRSAALLVATAALVALVSCSGGDVSHPSDVGLWRTEPDLTIGVLAGDPAQEFGFISDVSVTSDGSIVVLDAQALQIRLFDAEGRFLTSFGRGGSGPGEFGFAVREVLVGTADTIFVPDAINQRIHLFLPNGELAGSIPFPLFGGASMDWQLVSGHFVFRWFTPTRDGLIVLDRGGGEERWIAEFTETLAAIPTNPMAILSTPSNPFSPTASWTSTSNRIIFGTTDNGRLQTVGLEEGAPQSLPYVLSRRPVGGPDREQIELLWEQRARSRGMPENFPLPPLAVPDSFPAFVSIMSGPDGTLWVQRIGPPSEMDTDALGGFDFSPLGGSSWVVMDSTGHFLGEVEIPGRVRIKEFRDGSFYGIGEGASGEPQVVRLGVVRD